MVAIICGGVGRSGGGGAVSQLTDLVVAGLAIICGGVGLRRCSSDLERRSAKGGGTFDLLVLCRFGGGGACKHHNQPFGVSQLTDLVVAGLAILCGGMGLRRCSNDLERRSAKGGGTFDLLVLCRSGGGGVCKHHNQPFIQKESGAVEVESGAVEGS